MHQSSADMPAVQHPFLEEKPCGLEVPAPLPLQLARCHLLALYVLHAQSADTVTFVNIHE